MAGTWRSTSAATNLVDGDDNDQPDVFVHDREARTIQRVSVGPSGAEADGQSGNASISGDGQRRVVRGRGRKTSWSPTPTGAPTCSSGTERQAYTERVSVDDAGAQASRRSLNAAHQRGGVRGGVRVAGHEPHRQRHRREGRCLRARAAATHRGPGCSTSYPRVARCFISLPKRARSSAAVPGIKGRDFVPITQVRQIPVGSLLDTRKGTIRLTSARNTAGATQTADFAAGVFQVLQSRRRASKGLTDLRLKGSSFRSCRARKSTKEASISRRSKRRIRRLRGNGRGRFRTRGRYSAATVRGTNWTTTDRCDGTLTQVKRGRVLVRDFRRRRTIVVRAGKRYLARAKR